MQWDGGQIDPLVCLAVESVEGAVRSKGKTHLSNRVQTPKFSIPVGSGTQDVVLEGFGEAVALDAFRQDPGRTTVDPLLEVYCRAWKQFAEKNWEAHTSCFTTSSREKYRKWLAQAPPSVIEGYHKAKLNEGRNVRFVVNADPIFLIAYATKSGDGIEIFNWEYAARESGSGEIKLTNFYYGGILDDLIRSERLFERLLGR